jgi:hypothetical protein
VWTVKTFWWVLAGLALLVGVLGVQVMGRTRPSAGCTSSVVIVRGPHGEPVECVCFDGVVSTCFHPGP